MDNDLTYKTILNSIIPNKLFDDMACESCSTKFTLFKRKKQCKDCLRYYCTDCVIRRGDRVLSCDNCSMLSRRPLIKSQILKMKSKDLKQYLIAKKVSLRGCVEKEDLVNILMQYANNGEPVTINERQEINMNPQETQNRPNNSSPRRSRSPSTNPIITEEVNETFDENISSPVRRVADIQGIDIVEIGLDDDDDDDDIIVTTTVTTTTSTTTTTSVVTEQDHQPIITEEQDQPVEQQHEPGPENLDNYLVNSNENLSRESTDVLTEIKSITGIVKLSDIAQRSHLEYLNVKQLKDLLRTNRVDYRGCVERSELLDRAMRLWDDHKSSREDATVVDKQQDDGLCKICWDSPIECVILECGHMACCIECGKQMNECPICRQYVVRVVRFFKA